MKPDKDELDIFAKLGLTGRQTEVYLEFLKMKDSTVKSIAKNLQISRAEVYQTLPKLEEMGLVQRIIDKPVKYTARPIERGLSILIEQRMQALKDIRARADNLAERFRRIDQEETNQEYPAKYVLWLRESQATTVDSIIRECQNNLDVMFDWRILRRVIKIYLEAYKKALRNGVKVRLITDAAKKGEMQEVIKPLRALGSIQIRQSSTFPSASLAIFDNKIVDVITSPMTVSNMACLRSDDRDFVSMMIDYFELKWSGANSGRSLPSATRTNHLNQMALEKG